MRTNRNYLTEEEGEQIQKVISGLGYLFDSDDLHLLVDAYHPEIERADYCLIIPNGRVVNKNADKSN